MSDFEVLEVVDYEKVYADVEGTDWGGVLIKGRTIYSEVWF